MKKNGIVRIWKTLGIFGIIVPLQYIAVVLFNFLYTDNAVDTDTAKLLRHAMEMSKNHTLNIREWIHTTTMEWDTSALLSAPLNMIIHNIYISTALANALITLLFICLIIMLYDRFGLKLKSALFACALFLIPYAFGMLDYYNLLMFGGAQYVFRVMIPVMLLILIMTPESKRKSPGTIALSLLCGILILIAAISSGLYIVVSCVLPVVVIVMLDALCSGTLKRYDIYQYAVCGVAFVLAATGSIVSVRIGEASFGNSMSLLRWYDLRYYIDCMAEGYFRLMGAMPGAVQDESVAVFSLRGIAFLIKLMISFVMIIVFISGVRLIFQKKEKPDRMPDIKAGADAPGIHKTISDPHNDIRYYLCGVALFNLIILLVCETRYNSQNTTLEYRYLLPVVMPLLLSVPVQISKWEASWSDLLKKTVGLILPVAIIFTMVVCYVDAHNGLDPYAYCYEIQKYVEASGYDTVIFVDDRGSAECLRLIDPDREYEAYSASNNSMDIVDYYEAAMHADFYADAHLLFAVTGSSLSDTIGEDKASHYTLRDSMLWFDIYEAQEFVLVE